MELLSSSMPMLKKLQWWWEVFLPPGQYQIKDKKTAQLIPLVPNAMQHRLFMVMVNLARASKPIRIIVLKARKEGCSTQIQAIHSSFAQFTPHWRSRTIAHTDDSTDDIHDICKRFFRNFKGDPKPLNIGNPIEFDHDSDITTRTAGGLHVSSGANINALHLSELAKWQGTRIPIKDQLASVLQSVPEQPNSLIIIESTASMQDTTGQFKERWEAAHTPDSPYVPFFSPWIEDRTYRIHDASILEPTNYESDIKVRFGLDDEQLAWRRAKIAGDFAGDEIFFKQEYPITAEEAFQTATGRVFPMLTEHSHARTIPLGELLAGGYRFYRAIDWGGVDPFVCLWIAHRRGDPGFSIDKETCPDAWREFTGYAYDDNGRPRDINNHTCDAARYAIAHFDLTGHVHIYREMFIPNAAARNLSILDHAKQILQMSKREPVTDTVADRSQPGSITLMQQQGLSMAAARTLQGGSGRGEILDGVNQMHALMIGELPLLYAAPPPTWQDRVMRRSTELGIEFGMTSTEALIEMARYKQERSHKYDEVYGAYA